jgi:integrase
VVVQMVRRAASPGFESWWRRAEHVGFCANPIHLLGTDTFGRQHQVLSRCNNRRAVACPSCSDLYARDRLYALWAVALAIGLRRGEALGLRWVDVDLVNGRVVITKALSRVGTILALRDVKTESSAASVPLPDELVAILRRHRLDQLGDTQVARGNTLGLVFTTKNGTPLEPRNVNRAFETLCRRAGVRRIRLHDLRHSCATLLFTMGVEAATVQRVLRHSSISVTTGTYVDVIEQVQRSAVAGMDSLLKPAK